MARVFLSYDREDATKARAIAVALERAGHQVWWDRNIKGGAQYSKEIDRALKDAEVVVVLWSGGSVESPWVRDEAAAGRDRGRLVPVRLDAAEPPLGFRQYQTVDLARWNGRSTASQLAELLGALEPVGGPAPPPSPAVPGAPRTARSPNPARILLATLAAALVAVGMWLWQPWDGGSSVPIVAVAPADSAQPAKDLANDLLTKLGSLQSANADALQLVEQGSEAKPDLTFKIGGSVGGPAPVATVALVDGDAGAILWSRDFQPPSGSSADLRQQVAHTTARVLGCSLEALSSRLKLQTMKLYLNGCAELHSLWEADPRGQIDVFARVTQQAPGFEEGWQKLLLAQTEVFFQNPEGQDPEARKSLWRTINEARKINSDMAEAYLAEAWLSPPRPISGWMRLAEKAVERNPDNPVALAERARGYQYVGRLRNAIEDTRRAVQIDPLSPGARDALASAFAYAGQLEAGFRVLEEAERLWPGASNLLAARYRFHLRYGDPEQALQILRSGGAVSLAMPLQESFLQARIARSPAAIDKAINHSRSLYRRFPEALSNHSQTLAEFGRDEELIETLLTSDPTKTPGVIEVVFRPTFRNIHRDPRFMRIAQRYGLVDYWRESETWPDLCFTAQLPYDCNEEAAKLTS